jgi:hypothetical protein
VVEHELDIKGNAFHSFQEMKPSMKFRVAPSNKADRNASKDTKYPSRLKENVGKKAPSCHLSVTPLNEESRKGSDTFLIMWLISVGDN